MSRSSRTGRRVSVGTSLFLAACLAVAAGCERYSLLGVESPDADYFKGYFSDIGHALSGPARMNGKDWLLAASVVGGIVALQNADGRLRHDVQSSRSQSHDSLADFASVFGTGRYVYPGLVAAWGLGAALDDGRLRETALLGFESVLLAG